LTTLALFTVAALAFCVSAAVIETLRARRARRRLLRRNSPVLHPLTRHAARRIRDPFSRRMLHYAGLFLGFLVLTYLSFLVVRAVRRLLASWF
jgi:hypothetical protein